MGKQPKKLKKLTVKSAIKQATASKIAATKSATTQLGQEKRKQTYAKKSEAVSSSNSIANEYKSRSKNILAGGKDSSSLGQLKGLKNVHHDRAVGIGSKHDFDYNTTRPAPNLTGGNKDMVKAGRRISKSVGGRKPPKR
jgi:hypothetical protein